ncbi:MAG TPA: hypothetical protein VFO29_07265 [Candidatus Rubrimentiphilum sp.]|nr:hypothetical protein [Candidatus Rubrimentiphilum sp.]
MKRAVALLALTAFAFLAIPASAATERIFVLTHNGTADPATIELIGSDRTIEEFELEPNRGDQRLVTLGTPVKIKFFGKCTPRPIVESVTINNSKTTLMIYVQHNCTLQINTHQK